MKALLATFLAAAALAAAGCGGDDSPGSNGVESKAPRDIVAAAAAALRDVKSYRAVAKQGRDTVVAEVQLPSKLRISVREGNSSAAIIAVSGDVYIRANEAYWREQGEAGEGASQLAGKWLKSPSSTTDFRDLAKGLDPETGSRCLTRDIGTLAKGGVENVNGRPAVVVIDKGGVAGTAPGRLYVATTGEPLPLKTVVTGNERPGGKRDPLCDTDGSRDRKGDNVTLSRFNESFDISAPSGAVEIGAGTPS